MPKIMFRTEEFKIRKELVFWLAISAILIFGFIIRLVNLNHYPISVNQDELSNIYDGYAIAETGADRWGEKYPMILKGFGVADYRPPMYAWLSAVTIELFGFSVSSGRLVSAILGCLSLLLLFLVARRMGGRSFAFFALLVAALSPWHIIFSRTASEGALLPSFFLISACYLWQKGKAKEYTVGYLALLGMCIGLGTNTYQAGKLTFFILALGVLVDIWQHQNKRYRNCLIFGIFCLIGASPQIVVMLTMSSQFFSRASMSSVPFSFSFDYFSTILGNIASNISPDFLFFSSKKYNNLSVARLLTVEVLVFYVGLFFVHKAINPKQAIKPSYVYLILFAAILPSALTVDNPHALRSSSLLAVLPFITAAGIKVIHQFISNHSLKTIFIVVTPILIIWNGLFFINTYINSEELKNLGMQALLVKASKKMNELKDDYDKIYVEINGNQQYIYILTYCNIAPQDFQAGDIEMNYAEWDDFRRMGKYYFVNPSEIEEKAKNDKLNSLVVLKNRDNRYETLDSVENLNEKVFFYRRRASSAP